MKLVHSRKIYTKKSKLNFQTPKNNKYRKIQQPQKQQYKRNTSNINSRLNQSYDTYKHIPYQSPSPDKKSANQINQTTSPSKQIQDFLKFQKRMKLYANQQQIQNSNHSMDKKFNLHQKANQNANILYQSQYIPINNYLQISNHKNKKNHTSPHKLKMTQNCESSIKKIIKDRINVIKQNSLYKESQTKQNKDHYSYLSQNKNNLVNYSSTGNNYQNKYYTHHKNHSSYHSYNNTSNNNQKNLLDSFNLKFKSPKNQKYLNCSQLQPQPQKLQYQKQQIKYLRSQLQRYKDFVKQYQKLAYKNKKLEQTMEDVLNQLEQNRQYSILKDNDVLNQFYKTHQSKEELSQQSLSFAKPSNTFRRQFQQSSLQRQKYYQNISQYQEKIDELLNQNQKLKQQKQFFERKFIQIQTKNVSNSKLKLQLQSIANKLTYNFQVKLTKYDHQLQEKMKMLNKRFKKMENKIQQQNQQILNLERQKALIDQKNQILMKNVQELKVNGIFLQNYKEQNKKQKDKVINSKKTQKQKKSIQQIQIQSKKLQDQSVVQKKFKQILQLNHYGISQAFKLKNPIIQHPSQYDDQDQYSQVDLSKNTSQVIYKSSDHITKKRQNQNDSEIQPINPYLKSLDKKDNLSSSKNSLSSSSSSKLKITLKSTLSQKDIQKKSDSSLSMKNLQIRQPINQQYIYIDNQQFTKAPPKRFNHRKSKSGNYQGIKIKSPNYLQRQIRKQLKNTQRKQFEYEMSQQNSKPITINERDTNTLCYSYDKQQILQILRQNISMKKSLQKLDEDYRLQIAINDEISQNIKRLQEQLQRLDKQKRDWRGDNYDQKVCESKKAFNIIKDQIHQLDFQLQQQYKYLGSCLQQTSQKSRSRFQKSKQQQIQYTKKQKYNDSQQDYNQNQNRAEHNQRISQFQNEKIKDLQDQNYKMSRQIIALKQKMKQMQEMMINRQQQQQEYEQQLDHYEQQLDYNEINQQKFNQKKRSAIYIDQQEQQNQCQQEQQKQNQKQAIQKRNKKTQQSDLTIENTNSSSQNINNYTTNNNNKKKVNPFANLNYEQSLQQQDNNNPNNTQNIFDSIQIKNSNINRKNVNNS